MTARETLIKALMNTMPATMELRTERADDLADCLTAYFEAWLAETFKERSVPDNSSAVNVLNYEPFRTYRKARSDSDELILAYDDLYDVFMGWSFGHALHPVKMSATEFNQIGSAWKRIRDIKAKSGQ